MKATTVVFSNEVALLYRDEFANFIFSPRIIMLLKEKSAAVKVSKYCLAQPNSKQASTRVKEGNMFRNK